MKTLILSALLPCLFSMSLTAKDWPQFRGPDGNGISTAKNLPKEWSATEHVKWRVPVPGGWSSPVMTHGNIYLTAADPLNKSDKPDLALKLICLEQQSGKTIWQKTLFTTDGAAAPRIHKKNSNATPTPVIEGERIYVHFGHQGTAALNLDGTLIWKRDPLDYPPVHGQGASPIIVDDLLVFSCDGKADPFIIALDKNTGKTRWKTARTTKPKKTFSFCSPTLIEVDGKAQLLSPGSGAVFAYAPDTGKELWRCDYGEGYSVVPKLVYAHGLIFVSSGFDRPVLMAIKPGGEVAWETNRRAPLTPSKLVIGDELYFLSDNGVMTCANATDGEVHWQERVCGSVSASPIFSEGRIFVIDESGKAAVVNASKQFKILAENELEERTLASMAATDGALYIRTLDHLYRIGK